MQPPVSYKRYAPAAAIVGLAGLAVAAGIWLIQRQFNLYVQASVAVGLIGLAVAMLLNPAAVQLWLGGRQARYGGNVLVMVLATVGILVLVNYLVARNSAHWDLSEDQVNTLAPETVTILRSLNTPVKAVAFYSSQFVNARSLAEKLLERYRVEGKGQFTYEFHDPVGDPTLAQQYEITRDATIIVEMAGNREEINFASEEELTGALVRLSNPGTRAVYFLTGHGERGLDDTAETGMSTVVGLLRKQNYTVQTLNLQITTTVPADAKALVIDGPLVPLSEAEVTTLLAYANAGGSLLVLLDPLVQTQAALGAPEPLVTYLEQGWGVVLHNDVIVDLYNSFPNQPLFPLNGAYGASPITNRLQNIATVFPVARSVGYPGEGETIPNYNYGLLVAADPRAWGETNFDSMSQSQGPAQDAADTAPPLYIGVAVNNLTTKGRVAVFGDSDFASNAFADSGANANLFVNAVNWVTVEDTLINLTPKVPTSRSLVLTDALAVNLIFFAVVVVMPLTVLVLGGVVWFQRRRHT